MERAIGVIDSGVGGLTVAIELMRQLPKEKLIYLGDTKRCPYGPRPKEEIRKLTWEMVYFLLNKKIKMLVIACNTATAYTLTELQTELDIPVVGVIQPGARAAINVTQNKHVGIIGTEGTIRSGAYTDALHLLNNKIEVTSLACPQFVPMVEQGILSGQDAYQVVDNGLTPIKNGVNIDTLILGCTHYPLLKNTIQEVMGNRVKLISSSEETARETSTILEVHDLLNHIDNNPIHSLYTTGELAIFESLIKNIFSDQLEIIEQMNIEKINL